MEKGKKGFLERKIGYHEKNAGLARQEGTRAYNGAAEAIAASDMNAAKDLDEKAAQRNAVADWHLKKARRWRRIRDIIHRLKKPFRRRF